MIAEKIDGVVNRVLELEHLVSPSHWGVLSCCVDELIDAVDMARNLEAHVSVNGSGLRVVDFAKTTEDGKTGVNLQTVADIMEDLAEVLKGAGVDVRPCPNGLINGPQTPGV